MVEFNHITKIYDNLISAVYDVSFKLDEGEFVFLIGPSGSGKTTIIKMLIRDEVPTGGSIFFNDVDITKINRSKVYKLRREIGVVFQDFKLVPDKTSYENVAFAMEAAGKKNKEIKETVPYVLDIVGLSNRMKAFPRQLSGGEQQRVAIARAIANNPKILIADEPTGNLDPASSWDIVQVLTKINNWGTTVIMSTHGTDIVNSLNKRVIQMEKGRVIRDDNKGQYELVQNFEEETLKNLDGKETKAKDKKKVYQVKIEKDDNQAKNDANSEQTNQVEEPEVSKAKRPMSFFKLFGVFNRNKNRDNKVHESIMQTLEDDKEVIKEESISEVQPETLVEVANALKAEEVKPSEDQAQAEAAEGKKKSNSKMAKEIETPKPEPEAKSETEEQQNIDSVMNDAEKISVDDMNLPKSVRSELKSNGFKTAQDIINAGPDELSKTTIIDPEDIILISKEIKKLVAK